MTNNQQISLLELTKILMQYRNSIIINIQHLQENYQRTSIKRVRGTRDENRDIQELWLRTEYIDNAEYVPISKFELSRHTATLNMLIKRQIKLIKSEDKTPVIEVAGLLVNDLSIFNNYTIVSDGRLNIKYLQVKISSKKLFELLKCKNVLIAENFDFHQEYTLRLEHLPLADEHVNFPNLNRLFHEIAPIKVLKSIIIAHLKGESELFVPNQLEELKNHYLSDHVYVNFPTTNAYTHRQEAIANGTLQSRVSYKIDIGTKDILNLSKFCSANKFLNKFYRVYDKETGEIVSQPNLTMAFKNTFGFRHKLISSSLKITKADQLMKAIFDDFLGLEHNNNVTDILSKVGADNLVELLLQRDMNKTENKEEMVAALTDAKTKLDKYIEEIYHNQISPLVFYIGTWGKLPAIINKTSLTMTAAELSHQYPHLQFSKYEQAGNFFVVGDSIISVYPQPEYHSHQLITDVESKVSLDFA